jgi:2-haloacid dehalogenase
MLNFDGFEVLTFDCYGTLIDWETGLLNALRPVFNNHRIDFPPEKTLELYGKLEAIAEQGVYRNYRTVLCLVLEGLGGQLGFMPTENELQRFSTSVMDWPAFPDSPLALQTLKRKYKLAILSNIDDDLFTFSNRRLEVDFDWVITAHQLQSYKPAVYNFQQAIQRIGVAPSRILHVAQSLFHDIGPAKSVGLSTVWVNRRHNKEGSGAPPPAQAQPDLEVSDLQTLANLSMA